MEHGAFLVPSRVRGCELKISWSLPDTGNVSGLQSDGERLNLLVVSEAHRKVSVCCSTRPVLQQCDASIARRLVLFTRHIGMDVLLPS